VKATDVVCDVRQEFREPDDFSSVIADSDVDIEVFLDEFEKNGMGS
jgi:hypothetical protein